MAILRNRGFKVKFIIDNVDKEFIQETDAFYDDMFQIQESEIEIKECSKVFVKFESQIPYSILEIQNVFDFDGNYLRLNPGETRKLFEGQNKYSMLLPGDHLMRVKIENKLYYSTFTIVPRHINDMQLQSLRNFINSQISGLSYDIITRGKKSINKIDTNLHDYLSLYKCYQREFKSIQSSIDEILTNPISNIEKKYVSGQNTKKDDSKTIRFSEKRDRAEKLEVRKYPSIMCKENAIIKSIILSMYNHLRSIESNLNQLKKQLNIELNLRKRELESKESILDINKLLEYKTSENDRKLKSLNQSLTNLNETAKKIDDADNYIENTRRMLTVLSRYVNAGILKGISDTHNIIPSKNVFKDLRYNRLYRSYKNIAGARTKTILNYKPSDILYEYFILLVVARVFNDLDFSLQECDFKELILAQFVDKIPEGSNMIFVKENLKVEVWYERELFSLPREALQSGSGFYTHTNNKLPDVRVDIYKNDKFIKTFIIEVKYRRFSYLWNDYVNTDTMTQIKNYKTTVQYISKDINRPVFPVEKVIVIYPGQHDIEIYVEKDWGNYLFLQIRPGDSESQIYGYSELKNIVYSILHN